LEFFNATQLEAGYAPGLLKSGRRCIVLVAKATYDIPSAGSMARLAAHQVPIFESDSFTGTPGESSPLVENDYAPLKARCDVILVNAYALAPGGEPAPSVDVAIKLNNILKGMRVVGPRFWDNGLTSWSASKPEPFTRLPITYENAWGGSDEGRREGERDIMTDNPVGRGFFRRIKKSRLEEQPPPNIEPIKRTLKRPSERLPALAFGAIGRNWTPRSHYGGTYDKAWREERRPLLPEDFDERYYQCAPEDQQTDYLRGGEEVILYNLTTEGHTTFTIPEQAVPMQAILHGGERHNLNPLIDTLIIDPQARQFTLTWRARIGLKRTIHEIDTLIVGRSSKGSERARIMEKPYWDLKTLGTHADDYRRAYAAEQEEGI
jgi:hypothetical protein